MGMVFSPGSKSGKIGHWQDRTYLVTRPDRVGQTAKRNGGFVESHLPTCSDLHDTISIIPRHQVILDSAFNTPDAEPRTQAAALRTCEVVKNFLVYPLEPQQDYQE